MAKFKDRTGEIRVMNNGLKATIVYYQNADNVMVQFENGQIANRKYKDFIRGFIKCPMIVEYFDTYCKITNPNPKTKPEFLIDNEDVERVLLQGFWSISSHGYIHRNENQKSIYLHRFIMNAPDDMWVDHKNHKGTDCRKSNLRLCTPSENNKNQSIRKDNISGYKGVSWDNNRKMYKLNVDIYFDNAKDAAIAYNELAIKYYGEFAQLNNI